MNLRFPLTALHYHALAAFSTASLPLPAVDPIVSFTFDDFPQSAAIVGGAILKRSGARGTYYASVGLMNTCNRLGQQFSADDLYCLFADNHEIASHTFSHISSASVSPGTFREDVRKGRSAIQEITGVADSGNFAYPFGTVTLKTHKALSASVNSCRTTFPGINGPLIDTHLLRANALVGDVDRAAEVRQLVLEAEARRHWLIFYTHDVSPAPSPFGCTPDLLQLAVEFALRRGCRILPVSDALSLTGKPRAANPDRPERNCTESQNATDLAAAAKRVYGVVKVKSPETV